MLEQEDGEQELLTLTRRDLLGGALGAGTVLAGVSPSALGAPTDSPTGNPGLPFLEKNENAEADVLLAKALLRDSVENLYPSKTNLGSMFALAGWFTTAAGRGFLPKNLQMATALNNHLLNQVGTFSVTSGAGMFTAELARMGALYFGNDADKKILEHEKHEVFANLYLVFLMSYLAHFAEQGIKVSPEADAMLKEFMKPFNSISGGWQLDETANRPEDNADQAVWNEHMQRAEKDMIKATTDLLSYSAATAILIVPTVYGTSAFAQGVEDKYSNSSFEYFLAKAHLNGKSGEEAEKEAIELANDAYEEFFQFKLGFVDNILAGLGVDGPCIPVFLKLFEANGIQGILNYYAVMVPNITKYTALGMSHLLTRTIGPKATIKNFAGFASQAVGETILNGAIINARILTDFFGQLSMNKKLDRSSAFVQDIVSRPNGEEIINAVEAHLEGQESQVFAFDLHAEDYTRQLKDWIVTMTEHEHHASPQHQERALVQSLHAVLLERYQLIKLWDTHDSDKKRHIIEELLKDDPILHEKYGAQGADALMNNESFRSFISTHLNNVLDPNSALFKSLLVEDEINKYPDVKPENYAHVVRLAIREFMQSLALKKTHVEAHYDPEAGKEVFGALSGQLIGAAIASTMANWMLTESVDLNAEMQGKMNSAFKETFETTVAPNSYALLTFIDELLTQQNSERGNLSAHAMSQLEASKAELKTAIDDYYANISSPLKDEKLAKMIESFAGIIVKVFQIPRTEELKSNLAKIYSVGAITTPMADNIAAVLFVISSAYQTFDHTYGEQVLRQYIEHQIIPLLPSDLSPAIKMTVTESLIILAAMIGINLGNGTLWGNGVQLGEKRRVITAVKSRNIGDLAVDRPSPMANPSQYTPLKNPYSFFADAWTLGDVAWSINRLVEQINGNPNPTYAPVRAKKASEGAEAVH